MMNAIIILLFVTITWAFNNTRRKFKKNISFLKIKLFFIVGIWTPLPGFSDIIEKNSFLALKISYRLSAVSLQMDAEIFRIEF